jgi:hypothetical protein
MVMALHTDGGYGGVIHTCVILVTLYLILDMIVHRNEIF